jgi:nitrogen-specific signal transduction histidine kinase
VTHYVSIQRDVTRLKLLEAQFLQMQKMEAVGRLAGGVAHDFNNLLTVIKGYAELLLSNLNEQDRLRYDVEQIEKAGEQAASLTRQLLIFSRQEVIQPKLLNLNSIVVDTGKMLRRVIGEDIRLVTALDPSLGLIKADPGQMEQVIMNLMINARDAMPQGGQLRVETASVLVTEALLLQPMTIQPGYYVQLTVSDTGTGMDEETLSHIFEPFYTTKEQSKGTGLGLSTVYAIVTQMNGSIQVHSEPGQGTTFKIYLPRLTNLDEGSIEPGSEGTEVKSTKGTETILLVEDEEAVRELARRVLLEQGYNVLEAQHGDEALHLCEQYQHPIHLLLTDVVTPGGISGHELAESLQRLGPKPKMLYISGYADDMIVQHGGMNANAAFLQKPFTPTTLLQKVREVLDAPKPG